MFTARSWADTTPPAASSERRRAALQIAFIAAEVLPIEPLVGRGREVHRGGRRRWYRGRRRSEEALEVRDRRGPQPLVHVPSVVRRHSRNGNRILCVPLGDKLAVVVQHGPCRDYRRHTLTCAQDLDDTTIERHVGTPVPFRPNRFRSSAKPRHLVL